MNTESAINKIRKLLALARDKAATQAEAATAMSMASKLMLEHNVTDVGDVEDEGVVFGDWTRCNYKPWSIWLAHAVGVLFSCRVISVGRTEYQWVGKRVNTEACTETMAYLAGQIERLYKLELKRHGKRLSVAERAELRKTFKEAAACEVFHRAGEIMMANRGNIPGHLSLVVVDTALDDAQEMIDGLGLKKGREVSIKKWGLGTGAGYNAGKQVRIRDEVK